MTDQDIRWQQRFNNYNKALKKLQEAINFIKNSAQKNTNDVLADLIKQGLIQSFEYTHELAWKVMKDFLNQAGNNEIYGSKDATKEAFAVGLIKDGEVWMEMIKSRNKTSHTYNEETASDIFQKINQDYFPAFIAFQKTMQSKSK